MNNTFTAIRRLQVRDWDFLEAKIQAAFRGLNRKDDSEMYLHSLDVGRRVRADKRADKRADDIAIFVGYCHDLIEDTVQTKETVYDIARATFDGQRTGLTDAVHAANLVEAVSYTDFEYDLEKKLRKHAASKRWLEHSDYRVRLVKMHDIKSNKDNAAKVSPEFEAEYLEWAQPLLEKILFSFQ